MFSQLTVAGRTREPLQKRKSRLTPQSGKQRKSNKSIWITCNLIILCENIEFELQFKYKLVIWCEDNSSYY